MAITHAISGEPIDIAPLGAGLANAQTLALFKSRDLEVIRLVLQAGKSMKQHAISGEITIQCLEGRLDVMLDEGHHVIEPGQLLFLGANVAHGLTALEDASALLTMAVRKP